MKLDANKLKRLAASLLNRATEGGRNIGGGGAQGNARLVKTLGRWREAGG